MTDLSETPFVPIRVETAAGTLVLRPRRFGDLGAVADIAPDDTPAARLRRLFARVASLDGGSSVSAANGAETLNDEDLETVAEAYLALPDVRLLRDGGAGREAVARATGETAVAYLDRLLRADHERQLADLGGTFAALQPVKVEDLQSALAALDAETAALRQAVAGLAESAGADVAAPPAAMDAAGASRDFSDYALLTRSLARVTARSALLQANISDRSAAVLRRADADVQRARASGRRTLAVASLAALLAAAATALAALGLVEERENARTFQQWQAGATAMLQEERVARASAQQAQDARLQQIADRQGATLAALQAASAAPQPPADGAAAGNAGRHEPAKAPAKARTPQRKVNR